MYIRLVVQQSLFVDTIDGAYTNYVYTHRRERLVLRGRSRRRRWSVSPRTPAGTCSTCKWQHDICVLASWHVGVITSRYLWHSALSLNRMFFRKFEINFTLPNTDTCCVFVFNCWVVNIIPSLGTSIKSFVSAFADTNTVVVVFGSSVIVINCASFITDKHSTLMYDHTVMGERCMIS